MYGSLVPQAQTVYHFSSGLISKHSTSCSSGILLRRYAPATPAPTTATLKLLQSLGLHYTYLSHRLCVSTTKLSPGHSRPGNLNTPIIPSVLNVQSREGLRRHPFQAHRHGEVGRAPRPGDSEACDAEGARGCDSRDELNLFHRRHRRKAPVSGVRPQGPRRPLNLRGDRVPPHEREAAHGERAATVFAEHFGKASRPS